MSIIIKNLNKSYKDTKILENLNLEIKSGSIFGLLGPNGAGKTTLVSILNSLIKKDSGEVFIYDYNLDSELNKIKGKDKSRLNPVQILFITRLTTK